MEPFGSPVNWVQRSPEYRQILAALRASPEVQARLRQRLAERERRRAEQAWVKGMADAVARALKNEKKGGGEG